MYKELNESPTSLDIFRIHEERSLFSANSLRRAYQRHLKKFSDDPRYTRAHGNCILTSFQESILVGYLLMRSDVGRAEKLAGVLEFSNAIGQPIVKKTARRLINRLSQNGTLRRSQQKCMASSRTDSITLNHLETFMENFQEAMERYRPPLDHLVNADETILRAAKDGVKIARIESRAKSGGSETLSSKASIGSLTPFVSASGTTWLLVYCLKIPRRKDDSPFEVFVPSDSKEMRSLNSPLGVLILGSPSGLLNSALWDVALTKFIEIVRGSSKTPSREIVLISDNLGIHHQPESIKKALKRDCFQLFLPPNTSHFTQPLDNILFAGLKQRISKLSVEHFDASLFWSVRNREVREIVLEATLEAFPQIFTVSNIKEAWKNVGIAPFDKKHLQSYACVNLGRDKQNSGLISVHDDVVKVSKRVFKQMHAANERREGKR